jgi:hypothetical protein
MESSLRLPPRILGHWIVRCAAVTGASSGTAGIQGSCSVPAGSSSVRTTAAGIRSAASASSVQRVAAADRRWVRFDCIPVACAVQVQQLASLALAVPVLGHHERHVPPHAHKLHPFFRSTAFSASLSRLRSATIVFSRRFSSSSSLSRLASFTSRPLYFARLLYNVWSDTPSSRAISAAARPPSNCFTAPIIYSSLNRVFFISKAPFSPHQGSFANYDWLTFPEQVRITTCLQLADLCRNNIRCVLSLPSLLQASVGVRDLAPRALLRSRSAGSGHRVG